MKVISSIVVVSLFLFSCKKDNTASVRSSIAGQWEFVTFSGYPFNNNTLPPGNGRIIVFNTDGDFERRQHDTLLFRGRYELNNRKDCYGDEHRTFLVTNDSNFVKDDYIYVEQNKLQICSPNCYQDGGCAIYRKR